MGPEYDGRVAGFIAASCDPERGIKISMSHHCCSKRTPSPAGFVCSSIVPRYQPFQTSDSDVIGSFYGSGGETGKCT